VTVVRLVVTYGEPLVQQKIPPSFARLCLLYVRASRAFETFCGPSAAGYDTVIKRPILTDCLVITGHELQADRLGSGGINKCLLAAHFICDNPGEEVP
jgi:hypothetical protein